MFVDDVFYRQHYKLLSGPLTPGEHYERDGRSKGLMPNAAFDPLVAAICYPDLDEESQARGIAEAGLDALLKSIARDVLACVEDADAFFWRFSDTQIEKDHFKRNRSTLRQWDKVDAAGTISFAAGDKKFQLRKRAPDDLCEIIASGKACLFPRLPHGFLDMIARLNVISPIIGRLWPIVDTEEKAQRLGLRILKQVFPNHPLFTENFVEEVESILLENGGTFSVCLALKAHPEIPDGLFGSAPPTQRRFEATTAFLIKHFPDGFVFEDGIAWKRYASTGSIRRLIDAMRDRTVILIANSGFADLGRRWGLRDFHHFEIPPWDSLAIRHRILDEVCEFMASVRAESRSTEVPIVLTQAGGSFAFWLLFHLSQRCPDAAYFDIGQAINIWFLDDAEAGKPDMLWLQDFWEKILESNDLFSFYDELLGVSDSRDVLRQRFFDGTYLKSLPKFDGNLDFANLLNRFELYERAVVFAERSRETAPDLSRTHVLLARLYRRIGNLPEAKLSAERAIHLDDSLIVAKQIYAAILFDERRFEEFIDLTSRIGDDLSRVPVIQLTIAYEKTGRADRAIAVLTEAMRQLGEKPQFTNRLNQLVKKQGA
ncbi:hypothetical protein GGD81_003319 [Rhodobium orientis]|nr:tetratricopeptide repeat protein [Rhodobium orientis]MBB4304261.1 hypothetical protein [Rhodobium orientis]